MNTLTSCENPKRIFNHILNDWISVPCGHCAVCANTKAALMNQRLDAEFACWKYCVFFTLTYSEENLPRLSLERTVDDNGLPVMMLRHIKRHLTDYSSGELDVFDDNDNFEIPCPLEFWDEDSQYQYKFYGNTLPYCNSRDVSLFIKRIRKHLYENEKDKSSAVLRYFIGHELGPDTYRPHAHGLLFFNSDYLCREVGNLLVDAWPFGDWLHGRCSWKFITDSCPHYASAYVSCAHVYPSIYKSTKLKPHCQFSKVPAIGTLAPDDSQIRKVFDSSSPIFLDDVRGIVSKNDVPLWRVFENRLFPRLPYFDRFSVESLRYYYTAFVEIANGISFKEFYRKVRQFASTFESDLADYLCFVSRDFTQKYTIMSIYYTSKRIAAQAASFGVSVYTYLDKIFCYYGNKTKYRLNKQISFESDFANKYNVRFLVNVDQEFIRGVLSRLPNLTNSDAAALLSFGFTYDEIFDTKLLKRLLRKDYALQNSPTYQEKIELHHHIIEDSHKNRSLHERYFNPNSPYGLNIENELNSFSYA